MDRTRSGNRTESETRSRDFPWVPSTTNDPAAVPRILPPLWITLRLLGCFGTASKLPWYFSFARRSSVMFLLSKKMMASWIEWRERERERRRVVSRRSSNGKYGFFGRVVNHAYSRNESAHRTTIIALSLLIGIPN